MPRKKKSQENKAQSGSIADRLNELRGELSVSAFARKCGIGASMMRNYFEGASPGHDRLSQIAKANDVTVDWLATGEEPKQRDAMSRIGLARDAAVKFALRRSLVPEQRVTQLMTEAFERQLDADELERLHGHEYSPRVAEPRPAYAGANLEALRAAIEAVEVRMPLLSAAAKASAVSALYDHLSSRGTWDAAVLQAFLDLIAGVREEGG